jgi:glycosyltransferase involved in cell wall biosynthesis
MKNEPSHILEEKICIVIPMYRVAAQIKNVIQSLPSWVWKIILVDDASPDDSAKKALEVKDGRIILLRHPQNRGVGGAMLTGLNEAARLGATVMVKMDGDGQMSAEYLSDLIQPILDGRADYVKGNRFFHTDAITKMPFLRRIGNLGLSFLAKTASGYWNIFDPTNGYVAIDCKTFNALNQNRIHRRYFFEISLLVELKMLRAVVVDVAMPAIYQNEISSLSIRQVLWEFPWLLTKGFFYRLWMQYFVLDFSVGSLFLIIGSLLSGFGILWGVVWWTISIISGQIASTGTVMIAALPLILGFQLLLQTLVFDVQNISRTPFTSNAEYRRIKRS